jgi:hypothetical protein
MRVPAIRVCARKGKVAAFPRTSFPPIKTQTRLFVKQGDSSGVAEVRSLFGLWNDALATLDSSVVASRYAKDAVLLPTVSDTPRTDYASIKDYFDAFLLSKLLGKTDD